MKSSPRRTHTIALIVVLAGCADRPLDLSAPGGGDLSTSALDLATRSRLDLAPEPRSDLGATPDLQSAAPDFALPPDLASPPDLGRPPLVWTEENIAGGWSMWASAPDDVYLAGDNGSIGISHRDGSGQWTSQTMASGSVAVDEPRSVWGSSANDIYVGAFGSILHSTGDGTWTNVPTSPTSFITSIWGTSASNVWAVEYFNGHLLHLSEGAQSSILTLPEAGSWPPIWTVWGTSASDLYISAGPVMHSTDGVTWTALGVSGYNIAGSGPDDVYVHDKVGHVFHLSGGQWRTEDLPYQLGGANGLWVPGPGDAWLAGFTYDTTTELFTSHVLHSTGDGTWQIIFDTIPGSLSGMGGSGPDDVYFFGDTGLWHGVRAK